MADSVPAALHKLDLIDSAGHPSTGLLVQAGPGEPPVYSESLYRLYLVRDGGTGFFLEGQQVGYSCGFLMTLSPGERIEFDPDTTVYSCAFHHDFFCVRVMRDEVFCDGVVFNRVRGLPVVLLPDGEIDFALNRFSELQHISSGDSVFQHEQAISVLRSLLLQAADCKLRFSHDTWDDTPQTTKISTLVARYQNLVEEHYREHLEVSQYCDMLDVTVATLNRHVKAELGQTAKQLAQERLAIEARVALRTGERSIKEVAFDLGFEDPLYFSRFFRKQFGSSPTQYFSGLAPET